MPTPSNLNLFQSGNVIELVGDKLYNYMDRADYRIFNLETPLVDKRSPIIKWGDNLIAPTNSICGLKMLGIDMVTLANNHIMDQGERGLSSTIDVLNANNIAYVGVGDNIHSASKPAFFNFMNMRIGLYACVEHEFSIASEDSSGANPFEPMDSYDHVVSLKNEADYVVVLYHGGKEEYPYPSPKMQKVCRKFIDKGADLIICQHTHCVGCEEKYKDGTIVYGQGNFIFDYSEHDCWNESVLVSLDENFTVNYIPIVRRGKSIRLAGKREKNKILENFFERSKQIEDSNFIMKNYSEYVKSQITPYLIRLLAVRRGIIYRIINRLMHRKMDSFIVGRKYSKEYLLPVLNYLECEPHRELIITSIRNKLGLEKEFDKC